MYSIIIKNGTIFDGTGTKGIKNDVAIDNGKIAQIKNLSETKAKITIDASNLYVMPGFVDITTHSDTHWTIFSQPKQESFIKQGITTVIGGHGGFSLAPVISEEPVRFSGNINWQTMDELLSEIQRHKPFLNFATFVGYETIRRNVLKNAGPANEQGIKEINSLTSKALKEGAFGLSFNLGSPHSQFASEDEIIYLFETARAAGVITSHHLKDEGENISPAVAQLLKLAKQTKTPIHLAHFKALGRSAWEQFDQTLEMIELAQAQNLNLTCDFFPYLKTGSGLSSFLPAWLLREGEEKVLSLLTEKEIRKNVIEYLRDITLHYEKIIIASAGKNTASIGKTVAQISQESELTPEEVIISLLVSNELQVSIFNEVIQEKDLNLLAQKTYSMIASDGIGYEKGKTNHEKDMPHPRSFGTFPRVFSHFVKEKNMLTWEQAVYKMTGLPSATLRLKNRGTLKENNWADIVILNPETVKDNATYETPSLYPEGIEYVFVNGILTLAEGKMQEKASGQVLRKE